MSWDNDPTGLEGLVEAARQSGILASGARAEYYRRKNIRALEWKAERMPVTLIEVAVKGDEWVNQALYDMDRAEAVYKADLELVNARKMNVRQANAIASAEYWS